MLEALHSSPTFPGETLNHFVDRGSAYPICHLVVVGADIDRMAREAELSFQPLHQTHEKAGKRVARPSFGQPRPHIIVVGHVEHQFPTPLGGFGACKGHERHHLGNGNNFVVVPMWDLGLEALGILREVLDGESFRLPVNSPKPFKGGVSAEDSEGCTWHGKPFSEREELLECRGAVQAGGG